MKQLLNTLFLTSDGYYVRIDHETVVVEEEKQIKLKVPLHHLSGLVIFGNTLISPKTIQRFAEEGRSLVFYDRRGKFVARMQGQISGNVMLRVAQHNAQQNMSDVIAVSKQIVAVKIQNSRQILLRAARETKTENSKNALRKASDELVKLLRSLPHTSDLDALRGVEGMAARFYFEVFNEMLRTEDPVFIFNGRSRRPPRDAMNALISFLYSMLLNDCISALEGVGLDPQIGFLHALRSGRPALGLDLMEELRSVMCDRLALALINRKQLSADDFEPRPGGAVLLNEAGRKKVVVAYQKRKQEEINHPVLKNKISFGLIPHIQARLLARHLRGDLPEYPPFIIK